MVELRCADGPEPRVGGKTGNLDSPKEIGKKIRGKIRTGRKRWGQLGQLGYIVRCFGGKHGTTIKGLTKLLNYIRFIYKHTLSVIMPICVGPPSEAATADLVGQTDKISQGVSQISWS